MPYPRHCRGAGSIVSDFGIFFITSTTHPAPMQTSSKPCARRNCSWSVVTRSSRHLAQLCDQWTHECTTANSESGAFEAATKETICTMATEEECSDYFEERRTLTLVSSDIDALVGTVYREIKRRVAVCVDSFCSKVQEHTDHDICERFRGFYGSSSSGNGNSGSSGNNNINNNDDDNSNGNIISLLPQRHQRQATIDDSLLAAQLALGKIKSASLGLSIGINSAGWAAVLLGFYLRKKVRVWRNGPGLRRRRTTVRDQGGGGVQIPHKVSQVCTVGRGGGGGV